MKKSVSAFILMFLGLALLSAGIYTVKTSIDPQGMMRVLPYLCIGLGCGIFGHGTGDVISRRILKNHPAKEKEIEIERQDERNITLGSLAKAKAYDMMIYVFGALMLAFALMEVDLAALLLLVFAYLFVVAYGIYYRYKYDKEM